MSPVFIINIASVSPDLEERFRNFVPIERKARADRFRFADDRMRSYAAWMLLRYSLYTVAGIRLEARQMNYGRFGKPSLAGFDAPGFNLSHSGTWVACAVGPDSIGVDIERTNNRIVELISRFNTSETSIVRSSTPEDLPRASTLYWALKESYLKFLGKGLSVPLDAFRVVDLTRVEACNADLDVDCRLDHTFVDDYVVALCNRDGSAIELRERKAEELLEVG